MTGAADRRGTDELAGSGSSVGERSPGELPRCGAVFTDVPLSHSDAVDIARLLGALADPVRLRLLSLVAACGEVCSCELEGPLAKSQSTVSHHTKVLAEAGLIIGDKRGRWMWWRLDPDRLAAIRTALGG